MRSLRVAVLDEELPYPLTSGKRIRTFNLLSRLAERHRITLICHRNADSAEVDAARPVFRRLGIDTMIVPHVVPPKSGTGFYARLAGNLLSPLPYSVSTHTSPDLIAAVQQFQRETPPDLWHCEWTPYAQVLRKALGKQFPQVPWLVVAHNVESLIWKRYAETEDNPMKRWYIRRQWKKFEKFERWAFARASWTVAVSESDADLIRTEFGGSEQTEVVDNGVDTRYFQPHRDLERNPRELLFLGSLDWRPNQDGIRWLMEKIWPGIVAEEPQAQLSLVGRNPPEWLHGLIAQNVRVYGNVPDVRPYLARCGAMLVPLRVGGGSRLKILEAMATATPVLSTSVGAEGLRVQAGKNLLLQDTETDFAQAAVAMIRNPEDYQDLAEEGRRLVLREYDWEPLALKLEEVWTVAVEQKEVKPATPG